MFYVFGFERVGVVMGDLYFVDPDPLPGQKGAERGVRLEVRLVEPGQLKGSNRRTCRPRAVKISPSSPKGLEPLARGLNPDSGGAQIVQFETASGGAVFSVGSITYPSALLCDSATSLITLNVLRRFLAHAT